MKDKLGYEMTASHSEKEIYEGCLELMEEISAEWMAYMEDYLGFDPEETNRDELPMFVFAPEHIVERLFLWHTSHSGGTSQGLKCKELGISTKPVWFGYLTEEEL